MYGDRLTGRLGLLMISTWLATVTAWWGIINHDSSLHYCGLRSWSGYGRGVRGEHAHGLLSFQES